MAKFSRVEVINEILRIGVVPVFYHPDLEVAKKIVEACALAGLRLIEFTNRGDNAWRVFSELVLHFSSADPGVILGAGSVVDAATGALFISSGANFVVGPVLNPELAAGLQPSQGLLQPRLRQRIGDLPGRRAGSGDRQDLSGGCGRRTEIRQIRAGSHAVDAHHAHRGCRLNPGEHRGLVQSRRGRGGDRFQPGAGGLGRSGRVRQDHRTGPPVDRLGAPGAQPESTRRQAMRAGVNRVVTLGEIMLRLKSPGFERLLQSPVLEATFGGGEANVAASLANFGEEAAFVTALPKNAIGEACISFLQSCSIDTSLVVRGGERLGTYYLEAGSNQRPSVVIYDRAGSAIANLKPGDLDWEAIFKGATWFHITGITPALSQSAADLSLLAVRKAKEHSLTVSCDYNYRKNLWKYGKKAPAVMTPIVSMVDVGIANEEDCQKALGIKWKRAAGKRMSKPER